MTESMLTATEAEMRLLKIRQELQRMERRLPRGPGDELKIAWLERESALMEKLLTRRAQLQVRSR